MYQYEALSFFVRRRLPGPSCRDGGERREGNLTGEGAVRLEGAFRGDISLRGVVSISMSGSLVGTIEATNVFISGTVEGDIIAHGKLRMSTGSKITGDIQSQILAIDDGASFNGRSTMLSGEAAPPPRPRWRSSNSAATIPWRSRRKTTKTTRSRRLGIDITAGAACRMLPRLSAGKPFRRFPPLIRAKFRPGPAGEFLDNL